MLLTTTSSVPDAEVTEILGIVTGSAVEQTKSGFKLLTGSSQDATQRLKEQSLEALREEARELIADAVVDVKLTLSSDVNNILCLATGTAVKLDRLPPWHLRQLQGDRTEGSEGKGFEVLGVVEEDIQSKPAVSIEAVTDEKEIALIDFVEKLNLDRTRAEALYDAGFTDLESIRESEVKDLKTVPGINPTIARTIKARVEEQ